MVLPLREQVTEVIRDWIISGQLEPGAWLIERELCERLGVSRTTVREAYRLLESEGLITMEANRGPTVARISARDARDLYELREAIECCAVRLFVERATEEHLARLTVTRGELRSAYSSGDISVMLAKKDEFYELLYAGSDNPLLWSHARSLTSRLARLRVRSLSVKGRPGESLREIERVFDAIMDKDAGLAEARWREHIRKVAEAMFASAGRDDEGSVSVLGPDGAEDRRTRSQLPELPGGLARRANAV